MTPTTVARNVKRILSDEEARARGTTLIMPVPVNIVIDPDALAVVFVFPNIPLQAGPISHAFWQIAVERGWAEENDGQQNCLSVCPMADEEQVAIYVEIRRDDTDYGEVTGWDY